MNEDRNSKIEKRAYEIWDRAGRPHGMEAEHWRQAEAEIAQEEVAAEKEQGQPARRAAKSAAAKDPSTPKASAAEPPAASGRSNWSARISAVIALTMLSRTLFRRTGRS